MVLDLIMHIRQALRSEVSRVLQMVNRFHARGVDAHAGEMVLQVRQRYRGHPLPNLVHVVDLAREVHTVSCDPMCTGQATLYGLAPLV